MLKLLPNSGATVAKWCLVLLPARLFAWSLSIEYLLLAYLSLTIPWLDFGVVRSGYATVESGDQSLLTLIPFLGNFLQSASVVNVIQCPSHGDEGLDLVLTSDQSFVCSVSISETFPTNDHGNIHFGIEIYVVKPKWEWKDVTRCNREKIDVMLTQHNWGEYSEDSSRIHDMCSRFLSFVHYIIKVCKQRKNCPVQATATISSAFSDKKHLLGLDHHKLGGLDAFYQYSEHCWLLCVKLARKREKCLIWQKRCSILKTRQ